MTETLPISLAGTLTGPRFSDLRDRPKRGDYTARTAARTSPQDRQMVRADTTRGVATRAPSRVTNILVATIDQLLNTNIVVQIKVEAKVVDNHLETLVLLATDIEMAPMLAIAAVLTSAHALVIVTALSVAQAIMLQTEAIAAPALTEATEVAPTAAIVVFQMLVVVVAPTMATAEAKTPAIAVRIAALTTEQLLILRDVSDENCPASRSSLFLLCMCTR